MSVYLVDTSIYGLEAGAKARDYTYRLMTEMHACVRVRHYSAPIGSAEYCDERVCLCVCMSAIISPKPHV